MSTVNFNDTTPSPPANYNNLKWQSDASGNISAYDPGGTWNESSWVPTITPLSPMTLGTTTTNIATFCRQGSVCFISFTVNFGLGGSASNRIDVSLPPGLPLVGNRSVAVTGYINNTGTLQNAYCYISYATPTIVICQLNGQGNYVVANGAIIICSASYRCV